MTGLILACASRAEIPKLMISGEYLNCLLQATFLIAWVSRPASVGQFARRSSTICLSDESARELYWDPRRRPLLPNDYKLIFTTTSPARARKRHYKMTLPQKRIIANDTNQRWVNTGIKAYTWRYRPSHSIITN